MIIRPPAAGGIGARVTGLDVRTLGSEDAAALKGAVYEHKLVILSEQRPSAEEYIAFARQLGRVQVYFQDNYHHPEHPEIFVSSNVPEHGKKVGVAGTGQYWHTDYQFALEPLSTTLVYPQILPDSRRETYYIDMARVYRELPPHLRRALDGRRAVAEGKRRYKVAPKDIDRALVDLLAEIERLVPPVSHPAVIQHPVTGEHSLYLSSGFSTGLEGLSHEDNRRLLAELFAFIEREEHVHTHVWSHGDILYWDNRTLLHRAGVTPPGERSKSYRIGVYDEHPFYTNGEARPAMAIR